MNSGVMHSVTQKTDSTHSGSMDWQTGQHDMTPLHGSMSQGTVSSEEDKLSILKARAKSLAHIPEETATTSLQLEIAAFTLGEEAYALPSTSVREVYPLKGLTPLPCTPAFVLGVINVRGRILPIIDLTFLLGLAKQQVTDQSIVIIMRWKEIEVGLVTNSAVNIRSLPLSTVHPPLSTLANSRARYLSGITNDGIVILDAAKLLSSIRVGPHED